jgi:hypothetical protein
MMRKMMMRITSHRFLFSCLPFFPMMFGLMFSLMFSSTFSFAAGGEDRPVNLTGKWQLSWEARLGTEHGTMQLEQAGSSLTGSYQGHLTCPKISGSVEGKNVSLKLTFPRAHPFTLDFTGTLDGDKMAGKFKIEEVPDGYDWHGENARPSNYSWTAVRQPDPAPSDLSSTNRPSSK